MSSEDAPRHNVPPPEDYDLSKLPHLKDLTIDNITENVQLINSQCPDPRLKFVLERLVQHMRTSSAQANRPDES